MVKLTCAPLMLQVAFGFEPFITGLLMIPAVLGSLASKPLIRRIIQRFGYRRTIGSNGDVLLMVPTVLAPFGPIAESFSPER